MTEEVNIEVIKKEYEDKLIGLTAEKETIQKEFEALKEAFGKETQTTTKLQKYIADNIVNRETTPGKDVVNDFQTLYSKAIKNNTAGK